MKTFKGVISSDFKVVVTDEFVEGMRRDALLPTATFLAAAHKLHPVNDEAFIEAVIKNGMRSHLRITTLELLANTEGMGGTVSPARIEIVGVPEGFADGGVQPQVVEVGPATAAARAVVPVAIQTGVAA